MGLNKTKAIPRGPFSVPILKSEASLHPLALLDESALTGSEETRSWYVIYTLSRREKALMRTLHSQDISFFCPIIPQRHRSPAGRMRTSYLPMFSNYLFLYGTVEDRFRALESNCIARDQRVKDGIQLTRELRQIYQLIEAGVPLTREARIEPGRLVRIRTGTFKNMEGYVIRRENETRLLVAVNFLKQGASLLLDDCEVEPLN
jgi:hypothetical protein